MSIRCSLLGHSYGETEIEREREEQGSEVVVTVREFEECERCGERKIVTENKEVTALQSPAPDLEAAEADADTGSPSDASRETGATDESPTTSGPGGRTGPSAGSGPNADAADSSVGSEIGAATDAEVTAAAGEDDAEILTDSSDSGGASGASPEEPPSDGESGSAGGSPSGGPNAAAGGDEATDAAESVEGASAADDDGVILDDDGDASDADAEGRTPGEWPEAETTHPAEADDRPGDWPAVGREDADEGYDAEPGDSEDADVQFGGGLTPESAPEVDDDEAGEVEFVNAEGDALQSKDASRDGTELSSGISAGADAPSLSGPADDPDVDAEFVCPECDYRQAVAGSSLRAGDICPECARGYLAQE